MELRYTIQDLLDMIPGAGHEGAPDVRVTGLASLDEAGPGDLSFLANPRYKAALQTTRASVVLVPRDIAATPGEGQAYLRVDDPSMALAAICDRVERLLRPAPPPGVHPSALVAPTAQVDASASVGPNCVVGDGAVVGARSVLGAQVVLGRCARVGEGCLLHPRVVVHDHCVLGNNVQLHPGVVIGSDGFGYIQVGGKPPALRHKKVPQIGIVVIEDDVEIGANSTVDRARFGETRIGAGTKIDNLVQVAHNVRIGRHCIICAQTGISGSSSIGDYVVLWGQVGVAGHLKIGDGAFVGAQAGVAKDVEAGSKVTGTPARPFMDQRRQEAALARLPALLRKWGEDAGKSEQ